MPQKQDLLTLTAQLFHKKLSDLETALNSSLEEARESIDSLRKEVDEKIEDIKQDIPKLSDEKLVNLMRPLIPNPVPGEKGAPGEPGKDGYTPRKNVDYFDGKDGKDGESIVGPPGEPGKNGSPDAPEQIRDKLETLKGEERLDKKFIQGIEELEDKLQKATETQTTKVVGGFRMPRYDRFSFTGDGSTTQFTLPQEPAGKGLAVWIYMQGQWLQPGVHFNISRLTLTTTFTPENGAIIEGFLQRLI